MIKIENLTKQYGRFRAVDDLSFNVEPGEILGFLGPNGAGKSTTMKMVAGFLSPTAGSISVCGFDVEADPVKAKQSIGYLPEGAPAYGEMSPRQFLEFIADIRNLSGQQRSARIGEVIENLHLDRVLHQPIETLSKGFKRRVGVAQAILHDPPVLIMDEPTDGLDPNQKHEVRDLIHHMSRDKIIVVSTHILEEVEAVCSRAIIISQGRILADDTPQALVARSRYHNAIRICVEETEAARQALLNLDGVATVAVEGASNCLTAFPKSGQPIFAQVNELLESNNWQVSDFSVEAGRIDDVFREITTGEPA